MFSRWSLEPEWKAANLPRLMALADAVSQRPAIAPVWQRHFVELARVLDEQLRICKVTELRG